MYVDFLEIRKKLVFYIESRLQKQNNRKMKQYQLEHLGFVRGTRYRARPDWAQIKMIIILNVCVVEAKSNQS